MLPRDLPLQNYCSPAVQPAADHHYIFPAGLEQSIDIQAYAASEMGMRVTLTRGSMDLSTDDGGLPPRSLVQDADDILSDSERVIDLYHDPREGSYRQIALAPCSPFATTAEVMQESAKLAVNKDVILHTHLGETQDENRFCIREFGCRPLEYLEEMGWLNDRTWPCATAFTLIKMKFNSWALQELVFHIALDRTCCLLLEFVPALELEESGVKIGIGVDGSASEDASNLIQETRHALQIQRLRYGSARVSHLDVIRWATEGSAACLRRNDIGSIKVGKQADLAMYKLDEPRFSGAGDPLAAVILLRCASC